MPDDQTNRRLAAILAADVVGYSRMMGADEAGTLAALKLHREAVFDPAVAAHKGRIVKLIGDGTLVEFASVVDAVRCALAIQRAVHAKADAGASRIVLRIGINLGDVIIEGDDIYGDGVNVAARLEPLAEAGGICVSSIVNESVGNRIDAALKDGGEVTVKNIARPIRVWKWHPNDDAGSSAAPPSAANPAAQTVAATAASTDDASIAVLPFNNMSGDPEQEYFSDGITEDIITDLSKVRGLTVIARNSTFAYKGKNVDVRTVGRELGVRSVLEGSIRRAANRVRINAQLINCTHGGHLWAERYDRDLTDIFAVQDEVTRHIVDALRVKLSPAEKARLADAGTTNVEAHDCFMRGREFLLGVTKDRQGFQQARQSFERAIELDPHYAQAYAGLGWLYGLDYLNRWSDGAENSLREALRLGERAVAEDPNEPWGHIITGIMALHSGDFETAAKATATSLALNPNFAIAYNNLGAIQLYSGRPLAAIPEIERAMRLDPGATQMYLQFLGVAYLTAGKYETAAAIFKQRIVLAPQTDIARSFLASALGHMGEAEEARRVWSELFEINPRYSFDDHVGRLPFQNKADVEGIRAGLLKAGLPV
jgi:adenylate cyclase